MSKLHGVGKENSCFTTTNKCIFVLPVIFYAYINNLLFIALSNPISSSNFSNNGHQAIT